METYTAEEVKDITGAKPGVIELFRKVLKNTGHLTNNRKINHMQLTVFQQSLKDYERNKKTSASNTWEEVFTFNIKKAYSDALTDSIDIRVALLEMLRIKMLNDKNAKVIVTDEKSDNESELYYFAFELFACNMRELYPYKEFSNSDLIMHTLEFAKDDKYHLIQIDNKKIHILYQSTETINLMKIEYVSSRDFNDYTRKLLFDLGVRTY